MMIGEKSQANNNKKRMFLYHMYNKKMDEIWILMIIML